MTTKFTSIVTGRTIELVEPVANAVANAATVARQAGAAHYAEFLTQTYITMTLKGGK